MYVITKNDVKDLLITLKVEPAKADVIAEWFTKDKQQVEKIAEGEVTTDAIENFMLQFNANCKGKFKSIYISKGE